MFVRLCAARHSAGVVPLQRLNALVNTPGRCVAEHLRDLADLYRRVFEHLPGDLETRFLHKLLEANAESIESSIQGAAVHPEKRGDLVGLEADP